MESFVCLRLGKTQEEGLNNCSMLAFEEMPVEPRSHHVLVSVKAVSLNMPDLLLTAGKFTRKSKPPFVLGQEGAGIVTQIGDGCSGRVKVGDHVLFGTKAGALRRGGPLELLEGQCWKLPDGIPFREAACLNISYNTAYNALVQQGKLQPGEVILVLGATGGTGLAAVQFGRKIGATVIAIGASDMKLKVVKDEGADIVINSTSQPQFATEVLNATENRGVDMVFDPVGGNQLLEAIRCTRKPDLTGARILILGFAGEYETSHAGNRISTKLVLAKELQVIGVGTGLRPDRMNTILELARNGWLPKPCISHVVPFSKVADGFRLMLNRQLVGKVVIDFMLPDEAPIDSRL